MSASFLSPMVAQSQVQISSSHLSFNEVNLLDKRIRNLFLEIMEMVVCTLISCVPAIFVGVVFSIEFPLIIPVALFQIASMVIGSNIYFKARKKSWDKEIDEMGKPSPHKRKQALLLQTSYKKGFFEKYLQRTDLMEDRNSMSNIRELSQDHVIKKIVVHSESQLNEFITSLPNQSQDVVWISAYSFQF